MDTRKPDLSELIAGAPLPDKTPEVGRLWPAYVDTARLANLGTLAGGIAHEFNNLVGGILGFAQLAKMSAEVEDYERLVEVVFETSKRAQEIAGDLLCVANRVPGETEICSLADCVREVLNLVQRRFHKQNIELINDVPRELAVDLPAGRFQQVLLQLLLSVKDAMPKGGVITLNAQFDESGRIVLTVADDGPPIEPELHPHAFDSAGPATARLAGGGFAISQSIMRGMGGELALCDAAETGVTVQAILPASMRV
jgi:two-component system, NtrC family, sensor kinase